MTLDEAKDFLLFCRKNGVYQVKFGDLEAAITEEEKKPDKYPQEDNFNFIPQISPTIFDPMDIPEINHNVR